jgi:hypothetical protein
MPLRVFLSGFLLLSLLVPVRAVEPDQVELPADRRIRLMLLKNLSTTHTRHNETVPFVVTSDVRDPDGKLLIAKGTPAFGRVVWVRGEGPISATILDLPARLQVRILETRAVDGQTVRLKAHRERGPSEPFVFTRDNTTAQLESRLELREAWKDPKTREVLTQLVSMLESDEVPEGLDSGAQREVLRRVSKSLELDTALGLIEEGKAPQLQSLLNTLRTVQDPNVFSQSEWTGIQFALAMQAVQEVARLGRDMVGYIGGRLQGRNIRAPIGMDIDAYTAESVQIKVRPAAG